MEHTPGPWKVGRDHDGSLKVGSGLDVAYVLGQGSGAEANARLIAAAPELLEALERVAKDADESLMQHPDDLPAILAVTYKQVRAAIKAAKGELING